MEDFLPYEVFIFLTANGKPTGYSFTYSSNQTAQLSDPEKNRLWNENKLQLQEAIVNTLSNLDVNTIAPSAITSEEINGASMDMKLLKRIEELNFQTLQQEEKIDELRQKTADYDMLKDELTLLKQMVGRLMTKN